MICYIKPTEVPGGIKALYERADEHIRKNHRRRCSCGGELRVSKSGLTYEPDLKGFCLWIGAWCGLCSFNEEQLLLSPQS